MKKCLGLIVLMIMLLLQFACNNDPTFFHVRSEDQLSQLISDDERKQQIETLEIEGVAKIPDEAFMECKNLRELVLGDSVRIIGMSAFNGCENLSIIKWPAELEQIGELAFARTGIKELSFPQTCRIEINTFAFSFCNSLETVTMGNEVVHVDCAFYSCSALKKVVLPSRIRIIGAEECARCDSLMELRFPKSVEFIDAGPANHSGVERIIFEGSPIAVCGLITTLDDYPNLNEIIFLEGPPQQDEQQAELADLEYAPELPFYMGDRRVELRYLSAYRDLWSPNGETTWHGFPLVECGTIDELLGYEGTVR